MERLTPSPPGQEAGYLGYPLRPPDCLFGHLSSLTKPQLERPQTLRSHRWSVEVYLALKYHTRSTRTIGRFYDRDQIVPRSILWHELPFSSTYSNGHNIVPMAAFNGVGVRGIKTAVLEHSEMEELEQEKQEKHEPKKDGRERKPQEANQKQDISRVTLGSCSFSLVQNHQ